MFDIWKNLRDLVHVSERRVSITNLVFVLHSKVTVIALIGLSMLVTSRQYLGDPIDCIASNDIKNIADEYCWVHSTFTRGRLDQEGRWGYEAEESEIVPGIRPEVEGDDEKKYHTYYQWVWAVLFLQGGLFYFPYLLWKTCDKGRLKLLVQDLNLRVLGDEDDVAKQKEAILAYFTPNQGHHTLYSFQYVFCEVLNFAIVVCQILATDAYLNNEFSSYGIELIAESQKKPYLRRDALSRVFPIVTACRIATGGPAFNTMEYDLLCVLPINILNEKIYIFLWFWFIFLAAVSALNLVYRLITIVIPPLRPYLLRTHIQRGSGSMWKIKLGYGDWFILNKLGENLNPIVFAELLQEIHSRVRKEEIRDNNSPTCTLLKRMDSNKV